MTVEEWLEICTIDDGRTFFESVPELRRPGWALRVLLQVADHANFKPLALEEVMGIAANRNEWPKAHKAFSAIRGIVLNMERREYPQEERIQVKILCLAEPVSKVIYNASSESAPFDEDSGWCIARQASEVCKQIDGPVPAQKVWHH